MIKSPYLKTIFKNELIFLLISKSFEILEKELKKRNEKLPEKYLFPKLTTVLKHIKINKYALAIPKEFVLLETSASSILGIFMSTVPISSPVLIKRFSKKKKGWVTDKLVTLPIKNSSTYFFQRYFPSIVEPKDWDLDGFIMDESVVLSVSQGNNSTKFSEKTIDAINISQQKKFEVSNNTLQYLIHCYNLPNSESENLNLPFLTKQNLIDLEEQLTLLLKQLGSSKTNSIQYKDK
jgi:hypothetical protein